MLKHSLSEAVYVSAKKQYNTLRMRSSFFLKKSSHWKFFISNRSDSPLTPEEAD